MRATSPAACGSQVNDDRRLRIVGHVVHELVGVIFRGWSIGGLRLVPGGISGGTACDQPTACGGQVDDDRRLGVRGARWSASWSP